MARYTYDITDIMEGAATEPPFLLQLPAGGRQVIAALVSEGEWRTKWSAENLPVSDEQWDTIEHIVAGIYRGIEDGENMDELSSAIRYLADNLKVTHDGAGGSSGGGCCVDYISDADNELINGGNGVTQEIIDGIRDVVAGSFTDTGSNYPTDFADRDEYDAAKCAAANQLYRDFRTTLGGLQILDFAVIVGSVYLLGNALFGTGGVIVGAIAAGAAIPASMIAMIAFMLSFILFFNQIGLRLTAIAERLDRETFVCAMFEATTYEEGRTALTNMVQDAHDLAISEGAFTLNELFEGKLLELVAVLVPNELLETVLQGAAILVDILVELPEDIDCAACGGDVLIAGTSLLQNPNMETDLSNWIQGVAGSWTWESSPATVGRGRYNLGATGTMEQNFVVTQQMVDENWQYRLQLTVAGSGTGASVLFRLFDDSDSLLWTDTKTAGSTKTFDVDTDAIPLTLAAGTYYVKAYVGPDDVMEYCDVTLKAGV